MNLTIRMPEELKEALRRIAHAGDRSMAQQILRFVRSGILDFKEKNPGFDLGEGWEDYEKTFPPETE